MTHLRDWLIVAADERPDRVAVADSTGRLTNRDLADAARRAASALAECGAGERGRVALLLADDVRFVVLVHAARLVGSVVVPLNRRATATELSRQLIDAHVSLVVHDANQGSLAAAAAEELHPGRRPSVVSIEALLNRDANDGAIRSEVDLDTPATIMFTSGTTGRAKGAVLTHGNHAASANAWAGFLEPRPTDRWLSCLPLYHVTGLATITRSLLWDVPLSIHPDFDPLRVSQAIDEEAISHLSLVAAPLDRLLDNRGGRPWPTTLRAVLLGGGPIPESLVRRALAAGVPVVPTYGLTETSSGVTALPPDEAGRRPTSAGRPLPGIEIRVERDGTPCPDGDIGEIGVRGPMVMSGYDGLPDEPEAVLAGGWLRTGDLGSIDADGYLTVADRRLDLIISGGENVYPAQVEAVLREHPSVADAGVVGVADRRWGAVPVAAIVPRASPPPTDRDLQAFAREQLAAYKVPARFVALPALPRSPGGKLLRARLRDELSRLDGLASPIRTIDREGVTIPYRVEGEGPPVVLLHGTLYTSADWGPVVARLRDRFTIVAPDRRASGSSRVEDPLTVTAQDHLDDLRAILAEEHLGPAVIVGHSYGGCIALDFAARHPTLTRAVVAYEPPYAPMASRAARTQLEAVSIATQEAYRMAGPRAAADAFMKAIMGPESYAAMSDESREQFLKEGAGAAADSSLKGLRPAALSAITMPVVLALGERPHDVYTDIVRSLADRISTARIEVVPRGRHALPVTDPQRFGELIERTVARLDPVP